MRYLFALIISWITIDYCCGQPSQPATAAHQLNDKAVNIFLKYNKSDDSIASAISLLDQATNLDSTYFNAWTNKLDYQCLLKKYPDAIATCRKAIRLFPDATDLVFLYGALQLKTGDSTASTTTFTGLLKTYNDQLRTDKHKGDVQTCTINKALVLIILGRSKEAGTLLKKLAGKERDQAVKRYILRYMQKTAAGIINEKIPSRGAN